ncbi:MAG: hypothetical protein FWD90_05425 [Defluviitaleaceae bacterium]|nr:hypothetical protein [Defluviitaleaceae bacterium]
MKRLSALLILCIFILSACGGTESEQEAPSSPAPNAETPTPDVQRPTPNANPGFYFNYRGNAVRLDEDINDVLALLGEPQSTFDRPSCAFEGMDRFFLFPGVQIQTYPIGGQDRVHTIMLMDDSVTTINGIFLGSTLDALLTAYGNDYEYAYGLYIFTKVDTILRFNVVNGEVQTISYELITD